MLCQPATLIGKLRESPPGQQSNTPHDAGAFEEIEEIEDM
jgi:hypothetical protein